MAEYGVQKEHKCFRKGGRRVIENPYRNGEGELNTHYSIRAKQFAAFNALRGFDEMIAAAQADAAKQYVDK